MKHNASEASQVRERSRAEARVMRQIEELCEDRDGRPPIVVECPVDAETTLLIFDVVVPKDLVE